MVMYYIRSGGKNHVLFCYRIPQPGLGHSSFLQSGSMFNSLTHQDHNIPYPRSSGARFCSAGKGFFLLSTLFFLVVLLARERFLSSPCIMNSKKRIFGVK